MRVSQVEENSQRITDEKPHGQKGSCKAAIGVIIDNTPFHEYSSACKRVGSINQTL